MARYRFWSDPQAEPKRAYRWVLRIGQIPAFIVRNVTKPSFTVGEAALQFLDKTFYYPTRLEWNTIDLTLSDPVDPDAAATIMAMIDKAGYKFPESPNELSTLSKARSVANLESFKIQQLGPEGEVVEEWQIFNPWIKEAKFGELAYDSDEMVNVDLTIRYDYAKMNKSGTIVPLPTD